MSFSSGVFPVYNIQFKVGTKGLASTDSDMKTVADMETFQLKFDGKTETWTPMTTSGWERALMTGKAFSVALKGKRNVGDAGNDYVAGVAWKDGLDCSTKGQIVFPNGDIVNFNCVLDVSNVGGDDSTKVAPLEFEMKGDGKPTYAAGTPPTAIALSSSSPTNNATSVATSTKPTLTFNNAIADASGITLLNSTDATLVANTISFDATNKIITVTPSSSLVTSKTYILTLSNVTDIYGQELASQVIKFTT